RDRLNADAAAGHDHRHDGVRSVDTGHGVIAVEVFEQGVPPRWRIRPTSGHAWAAEEVSLETERPDGARQTFAFAQRDSFLQSTDEIQKPHEFMARIRLAHDGHAHNYDLAFVESDHGHDHIHEELRGLEAATSGYQDAHELAHANDIRRR